MNAKHELFTVAEFEREVLLCSQPVLVEYTSTWNGACHIMRPVIENSIVEYSGRVKFCVIDCDKENPVSKSYGILQLPTFQLFWDGQLIDHIIGALSRDELSASLKLLLEKSEKTDRK